MFEALSHKKEEELAKLKALKDKPGVDEAVKQSIEKRIELLKNDKSVMK